MLISTKMKVKISEKTEIPEGIEAEITKNKIKLKKSGKELSKNYSGFSIKKENKELVLECQKATKREKKVMMTALAHIKNMVRGLERGFTYKLQICNLHFPMSVSVDKNKEIVIIKNFLGEVKERTAKILRGAEVEVGGEIISIKSYDKELAGQTAANIEKATRIRNRDRTRFQDGIFIIEKPKEEKAKGEESKE